MSLESLYLKLPVFAQNWVCGLQGWRIQRARFGPDFRRLLAEAQERERWPEARVIAYRDQRLAAFVRHAVDTTRYYREMFDSLALTPDDIRTLDDVRKLPVLTKATVQARPDDFFSSAVPPQHVTIQHTSGTTGGGLRFAVSRDAASAQWAIWQRYRAWHGLALDTWMGYFGGRSVVPVSQSRPPYWRINRPGRQILFSGYHLSPATLGDYVDELRRRRPPWLHGYPSLLALLAGWLLQRGQTLGYPLRWVSTGAENLLAQQREVMTRAFGVAPIEHYGMAEAVANVSQCPRGRMHVDEDFAAVEFIPQEWGGCSVVGTNFTNPAFPLVRYEVGDVVELDDGACDCGRPGRLVKQVDGRREDYVILKNGARLGRMDHIFKDMMNVREAQIVQREPGRLTVRIVRNAGYRELDEATLRAEFFKRVGDQADVAFEYVEQIPRSRTGKLRLVVSEIQHGRVSSDAAAVEPHQADAPTPVH